MPATDITKYFYAERQSGCRRFAFRSKTFGALYTASLMSASSKLKSIKNNFFFFLQPIIQKFKSWSWNLSSLQLLSFEVFSENVTNSA
jgi:hypothetical protein